MDAMNELKCKLVRKFEDFKQKIFSPFPDFKHQELFEKVVGRKYIEYICDKIENHFEGDELITLFETDDILKNTIECIHKSHIMLRVFRYRILLEFQILYKLTHNPSLYAQDVEWVPVHNYLYLTDTSKEIYFNIFKCTNVLNGCVIDFVQWERVPKILSVMYVNRMTILFDTYKRLKQYKELYDSIHDDCTILLSNNIEKVGFVLLKEMSSVHIDF